MRSIHLLLLSVCWFVASSTSALAAPLVITPSIEPVVDYPVGQPIPTSPEVPSHKQFSSMYATWTNRMIVGEYRRSHSEDADVLSFLGDASRYLWWTNKELGKQLNRRGEELERSGTNDPVFQLMAGIVAEDKVRKEKLLMLAIRGFEKNHSSPFLLFMAAASLGKSMQDRNGDAGQIAEIDRISLEALKNGLGSDSFHTDEMSVLRWRACSVSVDSLVRRHGVEVSNIFEAASNLPDWIKEFGQGMGYQGAAWAARTGGWASEVTKAGWEGWHRNLAMARKHLTKAWELNPRDPGAAGSMVEIAMGDGGGKQEMRRWFDRSVAAQMDFGEAYRALIWGLRPRWDGSHEEMLQFADECLRTGRFDTCVPYNYLSIVEDIASEEESASIYDRPEISRNCRLALDKYFETSDMPLSFTYGHTLAAFLDYRTGNVAGAKAHMAAIQFRPDQGVGSALLRDLPQMMRAIVAP